MRDFYPKGSRSDSQFRTTTLTAIRHIQAGRQKVKTVIGLEIMIVDDSDRKNGEEGKGLRKR